MESLIAKAEGKSYTPHPEGPCRIVCADVHDEGMREYEYQGTKGTRREVRLVFLSEVINEETGEPWEHSQWFTLSLNEKANLRKFLESWRGKPFTEDEARGGWDIMKVLGANGYAQFLHKPKQNGGTKAVISSIMMLPKGMEKLTIPPTFKRIKDRQKDGQKAAPALNGANAPDIEDDDDLPF